MIDSPDLPARLAARLEQPLPGAPAQQQFAPELCYGRHFGPPMPDTRAAAVLVLLFRDGGQWRLPMTLRPVHMSDHAGQVSFPGGSVEGSESHEECAIREFHEELGSDSSRIHVIGQLTPLFVFNSNFYVRPILAWTDEPPHFEPNPSEVEELLVIPLVELIDASNHGEQSMCRGSLEFRAPYIEFQNHRIWGATSMMLGELIELLNEIVND